MQENNKKTNGKQQIVIVSQDVPGTFPWPSLHPWCHQRIPPDLALYIVPWWLCCKGWIFDDLSFVDYAVLPSQALCRSKFHQISHGKLKALLLLCVRNMWTEHMNSEANKEGFLTKLQKPICIYIYSNLMPILQNQHHFVPLGAW